jgi:hypothetical protein
MIFFTWSSHPSDGVYLNMNVLDVYVRYKYEEDAGKATENVNERFYDGNPYFFRNAQTIVPKKI